MYASRPDADAVTASAGIAATGTWSNAAICCCRALMSWTRTLLFGPRLEQRVALGVGEFLAEEAGADHSAVEFHQRAISLPVEQALGQAEHHERIKDPADRREDEQAAQPGKQLTDGGRKTRHDDQPPNPGMN